MSLPVSIVDSHVHLWDPSSLRYEWLDGLPELNRPFLPENFAAASAGANVTKMVFVECGCAAPYSLAEVDWASELAQQEPRLCGIVAHAPLESGEGARVYLKQLAARPLVKGVRRLLQGESDLEFCLRPDFIVGVKLLAEYGYTFDICIRHEQLSAVTELVRRVPSVRFILDHFGKPPVKVGEVEPWATQLRKFAALPNTACKISGLTTEADWGSWTADQLRPYFETALDAFGADRVLFGGDWPVSTLATDYLGWLNTVVDLTGPDERDKLFSRNSEIFYRL